MGRWMESINEEKKVVYEMAPNFLIYCSGQLPKHIRKEFPILLSLELLSDDWVDELQVFKSDKIIELCKELSRVYRIINHEEFVPGLDTKKMLSHWTSEEYKLNDINKDINDLLSFFNKSIELNLETRIYL